MKKSFILKTVVLAMITYGSVVQAADWYGTNAFSNTAAYYFDRSSVVKSNGNITLWVKTVKDTKSEISHGVYSYASKNTYFCSTKSSQNTFESQYGKNGDFIKSFPEVGPIEPIIPGSVGEDMLKIVCSPNFPNDLSNKNYYKISDGDIFKDNQSFYDRRRAAQNDPAPK
ncbi:MAG: surface-adhesin E family protein [Pseudomonadota bacterium]